MAEDFFWFHVAALTYTTFEELQEPIQSRKSELQHSTVKGEDPDHITALDPQKHI